MKYTALFVKEENGGYSVEVPDLPGCFSQGETLEEAREHVAEAIKGYLEVLADRGEPAPEPTVIVEEVESVA